MALQLYGPLCWHPPAGDGCGAGVVALPVTLPVALLLVLARHGRWTSRGELAALFWPDVAERTALLNLRVHLVRSRRHAQSLPGAPPVIAERRRVCWAPPLHPAQGQLPAEGFELRGYASFEAWLREWRGQGAVPDVTGAAPAAAAPDVDDHRDGFVGRRVERQRLLASKAAVRLVCGEPGIGKTRLVAETIDGAAWLSCHQGLQSASLAPVAALLDAQRPWLQDLGAYRLDVARLLPDLLVDGEALPPLDALTARNRLFEGLSRCVEARAECLVIDDLQWADAATVDWLLLLARRGRTRWVATLRDAELPPALARALQTLAASGAAWSLTLSGLDAQALDSLRRWHRPELPPSGAWGRHLFAATGGNPFYASELLAALLPQDGPEALLPASASKSPAPPPLPQRVTAQLRSRRARLSPAARAITEAAAIAVGKPTPAQLASMAGLGEPESILALEEAQAEGLLDGTCCAHDLVRAALQAGLSSARVASLHVRAARFLAGANTEPQVIADHWQQAGRPDSAAPWQLRAALRLRERGDHVGAQALLRSVRDEARDHALALHAEILLAQEHLFDDLGSGRHALEAALARAAAVRPSAARRRLQAHALAGLVDNAVFCGDLPRAMTLARSLRQRLHGLPPPLLIECHQVLIEAAMRTPNMPDALASLQGLRQAGAPEPVRLSFEAQIDWFGGAVRDARDGFERLLARYPDYCRGLTIENDLAVMCHALGELGRAEEMARRSLVSWVGVPHTQALSSLVLGSVLTSRGDFVAACAALDDAERLGRSQGSTLFVAEAQCRRARLHWCAGHLAQARTEVVAARQTMGEPRQPLVASALALVEVLSGAGDPAASLALVDEAARRSAHPLVRVRALRAHAASAAMNADTGRVLAAARELCRAADAALLAEWQCEALWLLARWLPAGSDADEAAARALAMASSRGFGWLQCAPRW